MNSEALKKQKTSTKTLSSKVLINDEAFKSLSMFLPRDVKNAQALLLSTQSFHGLTWESEHSKLFEHSKTKFTEEEIRIIKYLMLKETPSNIRKEIWMIGSGAKREKKNNPNYYKNILKNYPNDIPSPYEKIIDMDIPRTFSDNSFLKTDKTFTRKLKNILLAYSRRNISLGYCQGFNLIAALLLQVFEDNEEDAFWVFVQIIENILPLNFYSEMAGLIIDSTIFNQLLKKYIPDLDSHLKEHGLEIWINNVIYKWFVSIFIDISIPKQITLFIWDVLFIDGNIIVFKAALGILKLLKQNLISVTSIEELTHILDNIGEYADSTSKLSYYLLLRKFEFDDDFIDKNRNIIGKNIIECLEEKYVKKEGNKENGVDINIENENDGANDVFKNRNQIKRNSIVCFETHCDRKWPVCLYDSNYKHFISNYSIIHCYQDPIIINDYFFNYLSKNNSNKSCISDEKNNKLDSSSIWDSEGSVKSSSSSLSHKLPRSNEFFTKFNSDHKRNNYKIYNTLLIDRREHLCRITTNEKEIIKSRFHKTFYKKRLHDRNSSFTATNMKFNEKDDDKDFHQTNYFTRLINCLNENSCEVDLNTSFSKLFEDFNPLPFCSKEEFYDDKDNNII